MRSFNFLLYSSLFWCLLMQGFMLNAITLSGPYIYVTNSNNSTVSVFPSNQSNFTYQSITPPPWVISPSYTFNTIPSPSAFTFSTDGLYAYICSRFASLPNSNTFSTSIYKINTTNLTQIGNPYTIPFANAFITNVIYATLPQNPLSPKNPNVYIYAVDTGNNVIFQINPTKISTQTTAYTPGAVENSSAPQSTSYIPGYIYLGGAVPNEVFYYQGGSASGILVVSTNQGIALVNLAHLLSETSTQAAQNGYNITNNSVVLINSSLFVQAKALAITKQGGVAYLYVTNSGSNTVIKLNLSDLLQQLAQGISSSQIDIQGESITVEQAPIDIAVLGDKVYVLNQQGGFNSLGSISIIQPGYPNATLDSTNPFNGSTNPGMYLSSPVGLVVLPSSLRTTGPLLYGNIYAANNTNGTISGTLSFRFTNVNSPGSASSSVSYLVGYNVLPALNPYAIGSVNVPTSQQILAAQAGVGSTVAPQ